MSVLIVDCDPCVREFLRECTQGHGWPVADAESGAQMRARIEAELPDIVLRDPERAAAAGGPAGNREWQSDDRSIDIRIGRLRRKVEPEPDGEPRCIRTVRNVGYRFMPAN